MSDHSEQREQHKQHEQRAQREPREQQGHAGAVAAVDAEDGGRGRGGPEPEAIRFFGTSWLAHDRGYPARRIAVSFGSLAATVAACLVLRFAYEGLESAKVGGFLRWLVVVMFGVCGAIAFRRTWDGYLRRPSDPDRDESLRGAMTIGFIGSLAAYFLRSLKEAPGESLRRREYEKSRAPKPSPSND